MLHVIELSRETAALRVREGCLAITGEDGQTKTAPLAEIGIVLLSAPHATCSVAALAELALQGTTVVVCDRTMKPAGMMLPFRGHHEIATRISAQALASVPLRRRLWKALIQSKITGQAATLMESIGSEHGLPQLVRRVRSGDPENIEARAARRYWKYLFGADFRRRRGVGVANKMLDYSYAVLRAAVVRGICAAGLHPSLGIQHHHRSNAFALADDLIEPFRPRVDSVVFRTLKVSEGQEDLTPSIKRSLVGCLDEKVPFHGEQRSVTDCIMHSATSMAGVFIGSHAKLSLPWL